MSQAKINEIIPLCAFELASSLICKILRDEIAGQRQLLNDAIENAEEGEDVSYYEFMLGCLPGRIYQDRVSLPNAAEMPYVNVMLADSKASETNSAKGQQAAVRYVIEIWTKGGAEPEKDRHGQRSSRINKRLLAVVRQILRHPEYRYLGLQAEDNFVSSTDCSQFMLADPEYGAKSTDNIQLSTITFKCVLNDAPVGFTLHSICEGLDTQMDENTGGEIYWSTDY